MKTSMVSFIISQPATGKGAPIEEINGGGRPILPAAR